MRCVIKNKSIAKHPLHVSYRYKTWTILVQHSRCLAIPKSTDKHAHEYRGRSLEYCQLSSAAKLRNVNKQQTLIFPRKWLCSLRQDIQTSCKDRIKCGECKIESGFYLWQSFETTFFAERLFTTNRMINKTIK